MSQRPSVRPRALVVLALIAAVMLMGGLASRGAAAQSQLTHSRASAPVHGGILTQSFKDDMATLDPAIGYDWNNWPAIKMVFDGLLDYDSGTTVVPRIAARMPTVSKDGLTYTFTLRKGVLFQNGREVTANDVAYTINRVLTPSTKSPGASFFLSIKGAQAVMNGKAKTASGIKVLNRYTVRFTLAHRDDTFLNVMAMNFAYIVPKEVVAKEGNNFGHKPVGTGPFIMKQWIPGQKIVFVRNPHYFIKGLPYLDGVTFLIGLDPSVAVLRIQRGQLDMLGDPIAGPDFARIHTDPAFKDMLVHSVEPETSYLAINTQMKPFNNVKVRQALNMAIDKERVVRIFNGRGVVANQILPPTMAGYDPSYKGYPYDPAKAKQLLAQAGYPHGFSTQIYTLNVDPHPRIAQSFQHDLAAIGIKASVVPLASATLINLAGTPHKVPLVWSGGLAWAQDFPDPSDFYSSILSCSSAVQGGWNWPFYCNHNLDKQAATLLGMSSRSARLAGYRAFFRQLMDQAVWVPVDNDVRWILHGPKTHGPVSVFVHNVHIFVYERIQKY